MATMIETLLGAAAGSVVTVNPDYIVVTDGPSHKAVSDVTKVANPEKVMVIFDHDVPTGSPDAAFIFKKINTFAHQFDCRFVQSVGVGYQWMVNEIVKPGQIIIGGGKHGSVYGSVGALGLNVTVPELARVLENGYYSFIVPETVTVALTGTLKASAMDAGMAILAALGGSAKGKVIEITGTEGMSAHEKTVICAMACGTGAFTAFVSDSKAADVTVELDKVGQLVKMPCQSRAAQAEAAILPRAVIKGIKLQAGQIGGITGGTIEELRKAAALTEGKKLALGFRLSVVPATSKDYLMALNEGIIEKFIDFGAQIHAVGDRSVVWQGPGVIDKGEHLITTGLYTFDGCMGVATSMVYSASVEAVMINRRIVMPNMLNGNGVVFGGALVSIYDECAGVTALAFAKNKVATVSIENVTFKKPILNGETIVIKSRVIHTGRTSMMVKVETETEVVGIPKAFAGSAVFRFVCIDEEGRPQEIPQLLLETAEDEQLWKEAEKLRNR